MSLALIKALEIYAIAIGISMVVALIIKIMVLATSRLERAAKLAATAPASITDAKSEAAGTAAGIPEADLAALTAAIAVAMGPHRLLHIARTNTGWAKEGRSAHHSSHSGHF